MALNSYYRSEPDPLWERFKEDSKGHSEFFDDIRDYLLEEHSSNFTQFIELCSSPYDSPEFWTDMAESGRDVRQVIDGIFQDEQMGRQQRYLEGIVISSEKLRGSL